MWLPILIFDGSQTRFFGKLGNGWMIDFIRARSLLSGSRDSNILPWRFNFPWLDLIYNRRLFFVEHNIWHVFIHVYVWDLVFYLEFWPMVRQIFNFLYREFSTFYFKIIWGHHLIILHTWKIWSNSNLRKNFYVRLYWTSFSIFESLV